MDVHGGTGLDERGKHNTTGPVHGVLDSEVTWLLLVLGPGQKLIGKVQETVGPLSEKPWRVGKRTIGSIENVLFSAVLWAVLTRAYVI